MKNTTIKSLILLLVILFLLPTIVMANEKITLKTDKEYLEIGEEFIVTAKLPTDNKLYALTATLSYDENVFEAIDDDNFTLTDTDKEVIYNAKNKKFGLINKSGEIPEDLLSVRLKVKKGANVGRTTISLTNVSASDGKNKFSYDDVSVEVIVTRDAEDGEVVPTNKNEDITTNAQGNTTIKTFTTTPIIIGFSVILALFIIICIIVNVLGVRNKKQITIALIVLSCICAITIISLCIVNISKKDVNNDGIKNYEDAKDIIKYLIDIEGTNTNEEDVKPNINEEQNNGAGETKKTQNSGSTGSSSSNNNNNNSNNNNQTTNPDNERPGNPDYDVDNDGDVDINDAGGSVQDTTENTKYEVKLSEINENHYFLKQEKISLSFSATITPNEKIEKVIINGQTYPVLSNDSYYNVTLDAQNEAGVKEYKISKVILSNKREIETKLTIKKEVLKDEPYVDMFSISDENDALNFRLEDKDNAFIKGHILVSDEKSNIVINQDIQKENHISYKFEEDVAYNILITGAYDLDSNELNDITGEQNLYENQEMYMHTFKIASNYDFKISNVSITDAIEKGQKPTISFDSTNNKDIKIDYVVINNEEYDVSLKDGNHYEVILEKVDTSNFGKFHIDIEEVVLDNFKDFKKDKDYSINQLTYNVLKNAPTIENITITENKEEKNVSVSYNFNDADDTLENLTAVLVDSTDKIIDTKEIENPKNNPIITLSYGNNVDGRYKVKFLADCNLGTDRHIYTDKNIGEEEILTQTDIYIVNATVTTVYPQKNQPQYKITYEVYASDSVKKIQDNLFYNVVSGITINGLNYDADKTKQAFTSTISFTVPSESGVVELEATRVQLQFEDYNRNIHQFFSVKPHITKIDVLKDKPTIENLSIENEDYAKKQVTFKFDVVDDNGGFESGTIELDNQIKTIQRGTNTVTFKDVTVDKAFELKFYGNYDLDTNTLPEQEQPQNKYTNELIHTVSYGLYDKTEYDKIKLTNLSVISNNEDEFFEKNEDIKLNFNIEELDTTLNLYVNKIVVDNQEYTVENTDNGSYSIIKGYNSAGEKDIKIEEIILNNGKKVTLTNPASVKAEVLKDAVTMEDFVYSIDDENINMEFVLKDLDKSVQGNLAENIKIQVLNEDEEEIETFPYNNKIQLKKQEGVLRYYIKVLANYDRDTSKDNGVNNYTNKNILDEVISIDKNNIELRNITDITLYREDNGNTTAVEEVKVSDLQKNKESYFVTISMAELPTVHGKIKSVLEEEGRLILILDYEYTTNEVTKEIKDLRIDFGTVKNGIAKNEARPQTLEELIEKIKKNPNGTYALESDLDAGTYTNDELSVIDIIFKGTLNGNGYSIKNLKKPLFKEINGGTVENLKLENVVLPSNNAKGALANSSNKAIIKNVLITGYTKKSSEAQTGALIGIASDGTIIENCKVSNLDLSIAWAQQQVGGLVGYLENSTIKNSYAAGKIDGGYNFKGGLVGNVGGTSTLENCFVKVNLTGNGGITYGLAGSYTGSIIAKNCVSLSTGHSGEMANRLNNKSENNYNLANGESTVSSITNITQDQIDTELFKDKAHFDETIWNLKDISYDTTPTFNVEKVSKINKEQVGAKYDENKETLYNNLMLLMPFYDSNKIVNTAEKIKEDDILATQEIAHIVPVDETGNIVTYLTSENPQKIKKIKVVFKNNEKTEYIVRYDNTYDMVASYRISSLKIDYTFNHYVIDSNSQLVNNLTNYLAGLNYEDNLDKLTPTADSRIYRDYYNDVTKYDLKEFVLKYLSNSNYTNTTNNETIDDYLEKEIKKDQKLEKLLYVYNYFKRFYSVDIDGIMLNDLMLFNSQGFNASMNPQNIAEIYLSNDNNFTLSRTNDAYKDTLAKYTGLDTIPDLLAYFVTTLSNLEPAKWYANEFQGYLLEINVPDREDIMYTLWDHIQYKDTNNRAVWHNYALPILTLPKNAAYIISTPTQFLIGAQRVYTKDPDSAEGQKELQEYVNKYAPRMKDYYTTAAGILKEAKYFNEIHTIQIDKRFTYDLNGNLVFQSPYQTQEPFHKNFNEVFGQWAHQDGNAATANGTVIFWRAEGALQGEWTYDTWSHETAHNIDSRLFLKNNGRRFDAGGEDYADNNLSQRFYESDITMNISERYKEGTLIGSNLVPERIDTQEEIYDFYQKVFDTIYIMDYLEGEAFLKLSTEEQSKLVVQVSYPNESKELAPDKWYQKRNHTVYQVISQDKIEAMHLETIEDLYENKLVMFPGVIYSTYTENRYGGEGIYKVRWYQPHNDEGRPDSYSIKWFAYEMLGYAGYDKGYIEYFSNINSEKKTVQTSDGTTQTINDYKTDLMALKKITGKDSFKDYKMMRFDDVKNNLKNIQVINVNEYFDKFYKALKADAAYVKKVEEEALAKYPNNETERNKLISAARAFKESTAVRKELYYALKNKTNDFIGKVYDSSKPQKVKEFTIPGEAETISTQNLKVNATTTAPSTKNEEKTNTTTTTETNTTISSEQNENAEANEIAVENSNETTTENTNEVPSENNNEVVEEVNEIIAENENQEVANEDN